MERELAMRRLELEFELEVNRLEKSEREAERQRLERDKDRDRAAEMERLDREKAAEMEKMKLEMEHELKLRQLEMSRAGSDDGEEVIEREAGEDDEKPVRVRAPRWEQTLAGRTKRHYGMFCRRCRRTWDKSHNFSKISSIFSTFMRCLLICDQNY